jgi:hypothetical protein
MATPLPNNAVRRQPPSFFHFRESLFARESANVPQRYSVLLTARTRPLAASSRARRPLSRRRLALRLRSTRRGIRVHLTRNGQMFRKVQRV